MQAATTKNEAERLAILGEYQIMDTLPEQAFDDITQLAAYICKTPIALVSLVDESRQWFKSKVGVALDQTPHADAFCAHALLQPEALLLVDDTLNDTRFADNRLVVNPPYIRFYAGAPLLTKTGVALGTLCVLDIQPRVLEPATKAALMSLARQVMAQLELRKTLSDLQKAEQEFSRVHLELTNQTRIDPVTQLHNRRALEDCLVSEWERAFRYSQPLSLVMLSIDEFQKYQQQAGETLATKSLRQVAEIVLRAARQPDFVASYETAAFVIVLPETDSEGAMRIAQRLRAMIEKTSWAQHPLTISAGCASYGNQADAAAFLAQATRAMQRARQVGGNCVMGDD
ncbi:MAG: sensor domain-containing diguanylate cyclase [Gallionella sp.]